MSATTHHTAVQGDTSAVHTPSHSALPERFPRRPTERAPISLAPIERVRSTSATQRRIENLQKLIHELSTHEMPADEIAWILNFSPSGARKYIRDLREAGVMELARYIESTPNYLGKAVYRICPDKELVDAFLAAICESKRGGAAPRKERPSPREQSMAGEGRKFHIMVDDTYFATRINRSPVTRDPLVTALFGSPMSKSAK